MTHPPLPTLGTPTKLPDLSLVRHLEVWEIPLLSELRDPLNGDTYLQKWCDCDGPTQRWLVVRTNTDTITEYLAGHLDLLTILAKSDFGLLVDQNDGKTVNVRQITVSTLPQNYLPMPHAVHDKSLRPA